MAEREPFVAIIGGLKPITLKEPAIRTAKEIGSELARAGFGIVVYSSDADALEPYVVEGFFSAKPTGEGKIRVRCSQRLNVKFKEEGDDPTEPNKLFKYEDFSQDDWEAPFYRSLAEEEGVDGIVLMGGAKSVLVAGNIGLARKLPMLAVDEFEGAAQTIWTELHQQNDSVERWKRKTAAHFVQDLRVRCNKHIAEKEELRRRAAMIAAMSSERSKTRLLYGALLALAATLVLGIGWTPLPSTYLILTLAGLAASGASGAVVAGVRWGFPEDGLVKAPGSGAIVGLIVGLSYFIPLWIAAAGPLDPDATQILVKDKIQFVSAMLVAFSAGIGFDAIFARLKVQAEKQEIGPPPLKPGP
jgi:hypothetical protein